MGNKISVVINTRNEAKVLERALKSLKWANEVVVCDMHSDDGTPEVARKAGVKCVSHDIQSHVELARNFNISQASNKWVLILDPDEEVPASLAEKLQQLAEEDAVDYVQIPRRNIIFGKWMKAAMWWPDYNIRFFKKGNVVWKNEIHRPPETTGKGFELPAEEAYALRHHHYETINQFLARLDRYTSVQADEINCQGYNFSWSDLLTKPLGEFLSRYFAHRGFEDGLHGLVLSLLQAFSFLVMYLKIWELQKFEEVEVGLPEFKKVLVNGGKEIDYWFKYGNLSSHPLKRFLQKAKNKIV